MSRETRSRHTVQGFTPLFDELVQSHSLTVAAVYGSVWRYCQMKDGLCYAKVDKIAERAGVSYRTALDKLKLLCEQGYLEDLDPGLRNHSHRYRLTGKLDLAHEAVTKATGTPSSATAAHEPPSSAAAAHPSSAAAADEDTLREYKQQQQQAAAVASFSDQERQALDALRRIGFPESDAIDYAREQPALAILWSEYAAAQEGLRNPGGYVRKHLDAGDPPPQEPSRGAPPPPTGTVYT